jgi:hypothetical protein
VRSGSPAARNRVNPNPRLELPATSKLPSAWTAIPIGLIENTRGAISRAAAPPLPKRRSGLPSALRRATPTMFQSVPTVPPAKAITAFPSGCRASASMLNTHC